MSQKNFGKMLGNLPKINLYLAISGGEIFTIPEELNGFLNRVEIENEFRGASEKIEIVLQTNGFWARTEDSTRKVLANLLDGRPFIREIQFTSHDLYHKQQGINFDNYYNIEHEVKIVRGNREMIIKHWGVSDDKKRELFPTGRARKLLRGNMPELQNYDENCIGAMKRFYFTINPEGKVSPCCFGVFSLKGNIFENSLEKIIADTLASPRARVLEERGIKSLARFDGVNEKEIQKISNRYGPCALCYLKYAKDGNLGKPVY